MSAMDTPVSWRSLVLLATAILGWASFAVWGQDHTTEDPTLEDCNATTSCFDCEGNYICDKAWDFPDPTPDMTGEECLAYSPDKGPYWSKDCIVTVEWLRGDASLSLEDDGFYDVIQVEFGVQIGLRSDGVVVWRKHEEERP